MTTSVEISPTVNDIFKKGNRRYTVIAVIGTTVKLKGEFGAEFNEPIQKLVDSGYELKKLT